MILSTLATTAALALSLSASIDAPQQFDPETTSDITLNQEVVDSVPMPFTELVPDVQFSEAPIVPESPRSCIDESDLGCFWDAATQGNGQGTSFYVDENGHTIYLLTV